MKFILAKDWGKAKADEEVELFDEAVIKALEVRGFFKKAKQEPKSKKK